MPRKAFSRNGNTQPRLTRAADDAARGRTVDRALTLLEAFVDEPRLSLVALARSAGLAPSTASRLLAVLEAHRFVERDPATKQYVLGLRAFELAASVGARLGLRGLALPALERLAAQTGESAQLAIADDGAAVCVERVAGRQFLQTRTYVGSRMPLHCTAVGKAMLAHWSPELVERLVADGLSANTAATLTSLDAMERELRAVRRRGYATNAEEYWPGTGGVAAPVLDARGQAVAAVGLAGPLASFGPERMPVLASAVVATARELSVRLGGSAERVMGRR
jgi:DNA-binding IclR family transcriptional regulator